MPTGSGMVPWDVNLSVDRNIQQTSSIFGGHFEQARSVLTTVGHLHMLTGGLPTHTAGWLELSRSVISSIRAEKAGKSKVDFEHLYSKTYVSLAHEPIPCSSDFMADDFNSTTSWGRLVIANHKELYESGKISKDVIAVRNSENPKFDSSSHGALVDRNVVSKATALYLFLKLIQ